MSEFGLKIKNIKAASLFEYNLGLRESYQTTPAMFSNSLFSDFIRANGMQSHKGESTRDIICLDFDFGTRSYDEHVMHLKGLFDVESIDEARYNELYSKATAKMDDYMKLSRDELREHLYKYGIDVIYKDKVGPDEFVERKIHYKMLYRSSAKAKLGQVMFINADLYDISYDWLTMGLGRKMPLRNAKIVEMSAYAPLTTSTIVDKFYVPVEDILIVNDQKSFFRTMAKVVKSEPYMDFVRVVDEEKTEKNIQKAIKAGKFLLDGSPDYRMAYKTEEREFKKCVVEDTEMEVENTLWDGMALIDEAICPEMMNGMLLLRNHFFKACCFRSRIQLFFRDWCEKTGNDYETYQIEDMFGNKHYLKDIKIITTDNAIKWKKFVDLMGGTLQKAYKYWCDAINADSSMFGIVKTDHKSKLGEVQQMSYQMVNTLPCNTYEIEQLCKTSVEYVSLLKHDDAVFEDFLRKNANAINHYEMLADLYDHNHDFVDSEFFKNERKKIISTYVNFLRKGKITVDADNLTTCGNPYALLLYCVGEDWQNDPTLNFEGGTIQCYTTRFADGEYLCGIRNPHNSPNNICYLHNKRSEIMERYFPFSDNIIAVNCIKSDIQSRANGMDFDSDFLFVTNNRIMVSAAEKAYREYPTIVNALAESGITYNNTMEQYAMMDNNLAKSKEGIGESSNLAQLAMTYYWTDPSKELYDNFVILSVLAQVIIDGCKREYEVDGIREIARIKKIPCMIRKIDIVKPDGKVKKQMKDYPRFMFYTKDIKMTKNGKDLPQKTIRNEQDKIKNRIDWDLECPMNVLEDVLDKLDSKIVTHTIPTKNFFIKYSGTANNRQMSKIMTLIIEYDNYLRYIDWSSISDDYYEVIEKTDNLIAELQKIKISNIVTINRIIETALGLEDARSTNRGCLQLNRKYCRKILNCLYKMDKPRFLLNFADQSKYPILQ